MFALPPRHASEKAANRLCNDEFTAKDFVYWCIIPIIIFLLIRYIFLGFYVIPSGSMMDTIEIGDRVITTKPFSDEQHIRRGDIVVFEDPDDWLSREGVLNNFLIKRVIGLPGDVVACQGPGYPITVNGTSIDESAYLKQDVLPSDFSFKVQVKEHHLFVMGDNRARSADSRYHLDDHEGGQVPISKVRGIARLRYWPLTRISLLDAHHEVFAHVPDPLR